MFSCGGYTRAREAGAGSATNDREEEPRGGSVLSKVLLYIYIYIGKKHKTDINFVGVARRPDHLIWSQRVGMPTKKF